MLRHTLCIKEGERNMQHANYVCVSVTKQKRNLCWQIYEILNKKLTFLNQHALSKFLSRTGRCFTLFLSRVFKTKLSLCLGICSSKRKGNCSDFTGYVFWLLSLSLLFAARWLSDLCSRQSNWPCTFFFLLYCHSFAVATHMYIFTVLIISHQS